MPLTVPFQSTSDLLRQLRGMPIGEERNEIEAELRARDRQRPQYSEYDDGGNVLPTAIRVNRPNYSLI